MRGHLQTHLHLLRGQHAEQQAEGRAERLEAQPVSAGPGGGGGVRRCGPHSLLLVLIIFLFIAL